MKKKILAIIGSASPQSSNLRLVQYIERETQHIWEINIFEGLQDLPHFAPEQASENTPESIVQIRQHIAEADGILVCSPEYVFSIPSGLKNLFEWCVASTDFSEKPTSIIVASAQGEYALAELKRVLSAIGAALSDEASLLIQGIKGKIEDLPTLTQEAIGKFILAFEKMLS